MGTVYISAMKEVNYEEFNTLKQEIATFLKEKGFTEQNYSIKYEE